MNSLKYSLILVLFLILLPSSTRAATESGSVGIEGKISAPPPTTGASISLPSNGASFTTLPITVSGICPDGLLVKVFKNNVFAGSVMCKGGSFSIQIDLFSGQNELVARVFDALDQPGPDSGTVTVTFRDTTSLPGPRISLTTNFAKRGANPGQNLDWPLVLSGGAGPYAINVDWGDGKTPDLISQPFPGQFTIRHVYDTPGVYNILVKATDRDGGSAFLQLVGVANGPLSQTTADGKDGNGGNTLIKTKVLWQPAALMFPLIFLTFWLGKRYELYTLRKRLERGQRPL